MPKTEDGEPSERFWAPFVPALLGSEFSLAACAIYMISTVFFSRFAVLCSAGHEP